MSRFLPFGAADPAVRPQAAASSGTAQATIAGTIVPYLALALATGAAGVAGALLSSFFGKSDR